MILLEEIHDARQLCLGYECVTIYFFLYAPFYFVEIGTSVFFHLFENCVTPGLLYFLILCDMKMDKLEFFSCAPLEK